MPKHAGNARKFQAEKDAEAMRLRGQGKTYREIGEALGYKGHTGAIRAVERAYKATVSKPAEEARAFELGRLAALDDKLLDKVFDHPMWAHGASGALALDADGNPYPDQTAMNSAIAQLRAISERRAKLLGLDAPKKSEVAVSGQITVDARLVDDTLEYLERSSPERAFYFLMTRLGVNFQRLPPRFNPMELTSGEQLMLDAAVVQGRPDMVELIIARARERELAEPLSPKLQAIVDNLGRHDAPQLAIPGAVEGPESDSPAMPPEPGPWEPEATGGPEDQGD